MSDKCSLGPLLYLVKMWQENYWSMVLMVNPCCWLMWRFGWVLVFLLELLLSLILQLKNCYLKVIIIPLSNSFSNSSYRTIFSVPEMQHFVDSLAPENKPPNKKVLEDIFINYDDLLRSACQIPGMIVKSN